jgi:tripartite-type tricarboxylate transporter receptor subunit TctC
MKWTSSAARKILAACVFASVMPGIVHAAPYPSKPVRMVVPSTPGVVPDIFARAVAEKLSAKWGVPVVVENRPGAAQVVGTTFVAKSDPDGYTILFGDSGLWAINPHVYSKLPYDPLKDLAPVIQVAYLPVYLTVNSSFPAKTLAELIAYAKEHPGKIAYATPGNGSSGHLAAAMLSYMAGINMLHVPYKGSEGIAALLSDNVQLAFYGLVAIGPQVEAGKFRILATTTPERSKVLPNVPTVAEAGVPGYDMSPSLGVLVAKGTPPDIIAKLNADIAAVIAEPDMAARFVSYGTSPVPNSTPERFGEAMHVESDKFGKLVKQTGTRVD